MIFGSLAKQDLVSYVVNIAIDRTSWGCINLLMISLIWDRRAYPIYWELLHKLGSSNFEEQTAAISKVLPLLKEYKTVGLGDREFCERETGLLAIKAAGILLLTSKTKRICAARRSNLVAARAVRFSPRNAALSKWSERD